MNDKTRGFGGLKSSFDSIPAVTEDVEESPSRQERGDKQRQAKSTSGVESVTRPPLTVAAPQAGSPEGIGFRLSRAWGRLSLGAKLVVIGVFGALAINVFDSDSPSALSGSRSASHEVSTSGSTNSGSLVEQTPPIGRDHTLTASQILYCMAEKTRIDSQQRSLNVYDGYAVDKSNFAVEDYNNRCVSYRYKQSQFSRASSEHSRNEQLYIFQGASR